MAKLNWRYGAMNSGKSDSLIKTAYNYTERGLRPYVMKPAADTKSDQVIARAGVRWPVDLHIAPETPLLRHIAATDPDVVLIDEGQFLTAGQVEQLFIATKRHNISVIVYGIRTDFRGELFPGAAAMFAFADSIEKLPTMCRCGRQAEFNTRIVDGKRVHDGNQIAIDGLDASYESLCGQCWIEK